MDFEFESTLIRQRAKTVRSQYAHGSGASEVSDWDDPDEIELDGYVSSGSSAEASDPVRSHVDSQALLVLTDPDVDVKRGDRIRQGQRVWTVQGFPASDVNPFTGWQPTLVARLKEGVG